MIKAIILGAGQRGEEYAAYALTYSNEIKIVGIAEPRYDRLQALAKAHNVDPANTSTDWKELLSKEKFADCVFVTTQDQMHYEPTMMALEKGYHVICEKPMSVAAKEIIAMGAKAKETGLTLSVCHTLRYSCFFMEIKKLIDSGVIGDLVSIQHIESIGYWHMAHSFVRGNWRSKRDSSPIIMAKCCHDLDLLTWLAGGNISYISSFGSLKHFKASNKPDGTPDRCMDGCPKRDECPYYAPRFYLEHERARSDGFAKVVSIDTSDEGILNALADGPYGRCVYSCDNDVPDNQVVNMMFDNDVSVSMAMSAFTDKCERVINVMGSHGQIKGNMEQNQIQVMPFASGHRYNIDLHIPVGGHSGSDTLMMKEFIMMLESRDKISRTSADISIQSHLAALAAEESRLENGKSIDFKKWCSGI